MSSIQEFFAHITKHGVAKTNRFRVLIPLPPALNQKVASTNQETTSSIFGSDILSLVQTFVGSSPSDVARGLNLMIDSTSIPGKNISTTELKYNSDYHKIPYYNLYEDQDFVFKVSRDMYEKNIIDSWMDMIIDPITHDLAYYDEYVSNVTIEQLDDADNVVYSVVLKDCFPISCNALDVSQDASTETLKLSTTFAYKRWTKPDENGVVDTGITSLSQTPFGPIINPVLNNPAVQRGLEVFEQNTGINLEGEALAIYNQVNEIVENTSGQSINKNVGLINGIKVSTQGNDRLTTTQQQEVIDVIDDVLSKLGG
jgi:hypothetical protein